MSLFLLYLILTEILYKTQAVAHANYAKDPSNLWYPIHTRKTRLIKLGQEVCPQAEQPAQKSESIDRDSNDLRAFGK